MARAAEATGRDRQDEDEEAKFDSLGKNKYEASRTAREKVGEGKNGEGSN
jgi:hypothetical protein